MNETGRHKKTAISILKNFSTLFEAFLKRSFADFFRFAR